MIGVKILKRGVTLACIALFILTQSALAETADYHLKRLEIQARAFLAQLQAPAATEGTLTLDTQSTNIEEQLQTTVAEPTWAENMVREDIQSLLAASESLREQIKDRDSEEYLKAKIELESLARRLRISTSPLILDPQQTASLELMMLELEESAAVMNHEREQLLSQKENNRRRGRVNMGVGLGYGYGPWGGWGPWGSPWGVGAFNPYFGGAGFYRPYRRYYRGGGVRR